MSEPQDTVVALRDIRRGLEDTCEFLTVKLMARKDKLMQLYADMLALDHAKPYDARTRILRQQPPPPTSIVTHLILGMARRLKEDRDMLNKAYNALRALNDAQLERVKVQDAELAAAHAALCQQQALIDRLDNTIAELQQGKS